MSSILINVGLSIVIVFCSIAILYIVIPSFAYVVMKLGAMGILNARKEFLERENSNAKEKEK